ncbi:hypothetical protein OIU77_004899 [Salix suchowensis]|uniref:Uncharacterized protein n=1 Tax=Salix suchowensis TaxID=1278906 RepID=A0ABQ9AVY5_9ROSI|nr:hypothetical protein OIU77_004899 [Salix suchowensis]
MASTPTHHFYVISTALDPTHLSQLFFTKQQHHLSLNSISHFCSPSPLPLQKNNKNPDGKNEIFRPNPPKNPRKDRILSCGY